MDHCLNRQRLIGEDHWGIIRHCPNIQLAGLAIHCAIFLSKRTPTRDDTVEIGELIPIVGRFGNVKVLSYPATAFGQGEVIQPTINIRA